MHALYSIFSNDRLENLLTFIFVTLFSNRLHFFFRYINCSKNINVSESERIQSNVPIKFFISQILAKHHIVRIIRSLINYIFVL